MRGIEFAARKYTLVHLVKQRSYPTTPLQLRNFTLHLNSSTCILGLIIDSRLSLCPHNAAIKAKMRTQTYALTKLTASTWGASLSMSRLLYTSIVCPIHTKASTAWHSPIGTPFVRKWLLKELSPFQNSCLRAISGAYKATPICNLETEVRVPLLRIHLDSLHGRLKVRRKESKVQEVIWLAVERVRQTLDMLEGNKNRGRSSRRRHQRAANGKNEAGGMGRIGERSRHSQNGQEDEDRRRIATQVFPQPPTPINHQNCLSWTHHWLPPDNPRRPPSL
jgi:hypothetical protein